MNNWTLVNVAPSLSFVEEGERVARQDQYTYTLMDMVTGEVKRVTCSLREKWADRFLDPPQPLPRSA